MIDKIISLLESKRAIITAKISETDSKLFEPRVSEAEKFSRVGWGHSMRCVRINVSSIRSDRLRDKLQQLRAYRDKIDQIITFAKTL